MFHQVQEAQHGQDGRVIKEVAEIVEYLRSRGLAPKDEDGRVLQILLELPVRHSYRRVSVSRAATLLYTNRRSLSRLCRKAGMPSPCRILGFGRILNTLRIIRNTGLSAGRAAEETGWPDQFCFSSSVHLLTGLRPTSAKTKGMMAFAEAWLQKELAEGSLVIPQREPPPCPSCGRPIEVGSNGSFTPSGN